MVLGSKGWHICIFYILQTQIIWLPADRMVELKTGWEDQTQICCPLDLLHFT